MLFLLRFVNSIIFWISEDNEILRCTRVNYIKYAERRKMTSCNRRAERENAERIEKSRDKGCVESVAVLQNSLHRHFSIFRIQCFFPYSAFCPLLFFFFYSLPSSVLSVFVVSCFSCCIRAEICSAQFSHPTIFNSTFSVLYLNSAEGCFLRILLFPCFKLFSLVYLKIYYIRSFFV